LQINSYEAAVRRLENSSSFLGIPKEGVKFLKKPQTIIQVSLPVRMDHGKIRVFQGFRVQHNNARGPYKGR